MDTDSILKQVLQMTPSSFSEREPQRHRAEKMLMRQFMLMKQQHQVPFYLSAKDMEDWLLTARSFLDEFHGIEKGAEARKLPMAEMVWTSVRRRCLDQMVQEIQEELEREKRLSLQLGRKVTLEGLHMFLSVIQPKAEQDVQTFLCHLSNKLLQFCTGSHTSGRFQLALLTKLRRTTAPLVPQVVDAALKVLLDEPEPRVEIGASQTLGADGSRDSALRNGAEAASRHVGKQLADAAAPCFGLDTHFTEACLLCVCTAAARDMVRAVHKRFVDRSKTFHFMDFDESFCAARESAACAAQDMNVRVLSAAYSRALWRLFTGKGPVVILHAFTHNMMP